MTIPSTVTPTASTALSFIRSELTSLQAYTPHPGGAESVQVEIDRVDTNESPYDLPLVLKQELGKVWMDEIESNRYPDGGHNRLKAAIASYVTEFTVNHPSILPSQICVGNGSDELLRSILIATCVGGEGSILVAAPTFSMYGILAQTLGIPVVSVDRSAVNFEVDLDAARSAIKENQNPPIRVVFMVHPNSPTGNALTAAELEWLRGLSSDILVVIDEAYFEFSQQTVVAELAQHPNWVVLRTFSKAFRLAAHRVGYAVGHPQLIATLEQVRLPYNLPSFSLAAAELVLQHRSLLLSTISETMSERDRLFTALSGITNLQVWRSDANFIYARIRGVDNPDLVMTELVAQLKIQGTSIRHTGGGLRISIGAPSENDRTCARIDRLLQT
ncbi:histidinol-phosphate transaminase [Chamaesiphon sp. VAR_48_metabat_135_sub]|uniref:histidinol-phosphate transaminase n=1 Tax=Chamaesiphon sp. VAR_48_metabat_135_sub TaxID=2964699 RepID=UPI00286BE27C|nr:histidinol-phosphate transaminase [Chamaesiphon sp. VAR_48_metabat_135_sub]